MRIVYSFTIERIDKLHDFRGLDHMRDSCNLYIALEGKESNALMIFSCKRVDAIDYSIGRMPKEHRRLGPGACPGVPSFAC